eukprot:m.309260 g.309260  ORF g.309260 m.309260 type:complete len:522 (+) comp45912_c0_seq1:108-1673(+)
MGDWAFLLKLSALALLLRRCAPELPASIGEDNALPNCPETFLPETFPTTPMVITKALSELEEIFKSQIDTKSRPALSFSVVYNGELIYEGAMGVLNKQTSHHPSSFTIFRLGSVTKVFVAIMAYQMLERGHIKSLDDSFQNYAKDFEIKNSFGNGKVTIRQMLSQLSGLPREAPCLYGSISTCPKTTSSDIYNALKNESLIFPPWAIPSYSNLGFALLGNALAEYMNTTFEDYVQKYILGPLDMGSTGFTYSESIIAQMATGYNPDGTKAELTNLNWMSPAGQMYSSARAMARLSDFFMSGFDFNPINGSNSPGKYSQVLSPEYVRQMSLPVYLNPGGVTMFGTPWEMRHQNNYTVCNKGGNVLGYSALFSFVPRLKLSVSALWSGGIDEFNASANIYSILIPAFVAALENAQPQIGYPENAPMYEGSYKASVGPLTAKIVAIQEFNHLVISISDLLSTYLWYLTPTVSKIFIPPDSEPCMLTEIQAFQFEFVYFTLDSSGKALSFTAPGIGLYGATFERQ